LQKAFDSAERSFVLSETLYREGEISFLDVLDAQRTVNEADSALVSAEATQAESFVRLYKSLGVY
jgi:multidrug efflux system outer membrane protein